MKNITNAYLILSVADIRAMLHAAELEQKVRGEDRESITIVLEDLTILSCGQVASWSVTKAVAKCAKESAKDIAAGLTWPKTGFRPTDCMNHSDAAI